MTTTERLAEALLDMRWADMDAFVCWVTEMDIYGGDDNGLDHRRLAAALVQWATTHQFTADKAESAKQTC